MLKPFENRQRSWEEAPRTGLSLGMDCRQHATLHRVKATASLTLTAPKPARQTTSYKPVASFILDPHSSRGETQAVRLSQVPQKGKRVWGSGQQPQ